MSGFPEEDTGGGITPPAGDIGGTTAAPLVIGLDGIPIVGTPLNGQVLEYNGTDYVPVTPSGSGTTFPGLAGSIFLTGRWYPQETTNGTALLTTLNFASAIPLIVGVLHTFTAIGVNATVAGTGGNLRFGLYADNGSGYPGALIRDYGTVSAVGTGAITITASNTLTAGLYWLVSVAQGGSVAPTLNVLGSSNGAINAYFFGNTAAGIATGVLGYGLAGVSGALPNPFTLGAALETAGSLILVQLEA